MSIGTRDVESELIESVCERVRERVAPEEAAEAEAFVRAYYRRAPADDLRGREPVDLYGAALSHWTFGRGRTPGEVRVRAYNPTFEQHGWQSPHTAIDIVSDDMPFIVDSVSMELSRREAGIHVLVHPVVGDESYMHIEVDRQRDALVDLEDAIQGVLAQVRAAVEDWQPMRERMQALVDEPTPPGVDAAEVEEARALLAWMCDHHFTFLGYREYAFDGELLRGVEGSGLGLLRGGSGDVSSAFAKLPPEVRALALRAGAAGAEQGQRPLARSIGRAISTTSASRPSTTRATWSASGASSGSTRPRAYREVPANIPVLRRKVEAVVERAGFPRGSHDHKALVEVLDTYPRDELFQISADELYDDRARDPGARRAPARAAVHAHRPLPALRLLPRLPPARSLQHRQPHEDRRSAAGGLRRRVRRLGAAADRVGAGAHPLHAAHPRPASCATFDPAELEAQIVEATRSWDDELQAVLLEEGGEENGAALLPPLRQRVPARLPRRPAPALRRSPTSAGWRRWRARRRSTSASTGRWRARRARCAASSTGATGACCSPTSCRCSRASG